MNDILKDIDKLKELQAIAEYFSRNTLISHLEDMIREKENIIHNFEKTYKEEECRR
jgi:hypothetical protein